jgi:hypothetical protein
MVMYPELSVYLSLDRMSRFRGDAVRHRRARAAAMHAPQPVRTAIQLRLSACREELERLAALCERTLRGGDWIVAEVDGVPVAAVSVEDGTTVYDPFRPTSQVLSLLELRRKQVLAAAY